MNANGHDETGRFAIGNPGGPGRPRRAMERDYLAALSGNVSLEEWQAIVKTAVNAAKDGDSKARAWLSQYLLGDKPPSLTDLDVDLADNRAFELRGTGDVLTLLQKQMDSVRGAPTDTSERTKGIVQLAAVALKALELNQLAGRIEALEAILKQRNNEGTAK